MSTGQYSRFRIIALAIAGSALLGGCGSTAKLFYTQEKVQAIQRDTITASGERRSTIQFPENSANGIVKLAPVQVVDLQPTAVEVPAGPENPLGQPRTLLVPQGFKAEVYATGLGKPRDVVVREDGTVFVSDENGRLLAIEAGGAVTPIAQGLDYPHGMELLNGALYYTDETRVYRYDFTSPTAVQGTSTVLTEFLPKGGYHYSRTIRRAPTGDGFYVSIGASGVEEPEDNNQYATVLKLPLAGGRPSVGVRGGLRNTVGMDLHPITNEMWGVDQGIQNLSEELAPNEVNILKLGQHYGYPYYYSQNYRATRWLDAPDIDVPKSPVPPMIELQGYTEPTDMQFYTHDALGAEWKNAMLIVLHGVPLREKKTGFKVIRVQADKDGKNAREADLISGWLEADGSIWGQPVAIAVTDGGKTFYVTDDRNGVLYRIYKP